MFVDEKNELIQKYILKDIILENSFYVWLGNTKDSFIYLLYSWNYNLRALDIVFLICTWYVYRKLIFQLQKVMIIIAVFVH